MSEDPRLHTIAKPGPGFEPDFVVRVFKKVYREWPNPEDPLVGELYLKHAPDNFTLLTEDEWRAGRTSGSYRIELPFGHRPYPANSLRPPIALVGVGELYRCGDGETWGDEPACEGLGSNLKAHLSIMTKRRNEAPAAEPERPR